MHYSYRRRSCCGTKVEAGREGKVGGGEGGSSVYWNSLEVEVMFTTVVESLDPFHI